eukprot:10460191-Lingulodinium_polyedra.AAC.1
MGDARTVAHDLVSDAADWTALPPRPLSDLHDAHGGWFCPVQEGLPVEIRTDETPGSWRGAH